MRDFAQVDGAKAIDRSVADKALRRLEVDAAGLDAMDRRYLSTIADNYGGGPVGVDTMAAALSEPRDAIEDIIEPYLIQQGFLQRTPRGRLLTAPPSSISAWPSRRAIRASSGCSGARTRGTVVDGAPCGRSLDGEIRDGRHTSQSASITRTPISPASSITPATCASWSAVAPIICACSAPTTAPCSRQRRRRRRASAFVVRHMGIDFKKPAHMDDVLDIVTAPEEVKGASITLHQQVMRGEDLLVEAHVQVAFVSGGRARPIPKPLRIAMKADQESGGGA